MSNTVSVEILTTLNKQGIDDASQAVEELRNNVKSSPIDLFNDPQNESVQYFLESLNLYSNGLTTLQSQITKFGKNFSQSLVAPFMDVTRTVSGLINQMKRDYGKGLDETSLITKSLGLREFAARINAINEAYDQDLGWSKHAFKQNAPTIMNRAVNNRIAELNAKQFKGQTPTLDRYVSVLANDNAIKNSFKAAGNGQEFTDQQIKNNLRLMLLSNNTSASRSIGQSLLAEAPFKAGRRHTYAHDIIPEQFRRAYYNNGSAEEQDIQNWRQSLKSPKQRINVKTGLYKELQDYIEHSDDASDVYDILEAAGVARREGGELRWAKSLTRAQAGKLAGLSLRQIADSRRGYAFYDSDIRDFSENTRQDRRMSGRVRSAIGVLDLLSRDGSIVADSNVNVNDYLRSPIEYRSSGSKIKTVGTPTQFIIPRTRVDSSTGRLVESDPNWKKKTGLFDQSEDDQFIVRTNSPIMKLISDIWKDSNGNNMSFGVGNGTFGFGRDESTGKPIYKTPPILTLSTKPYFLKDGTINESRLPELKNLVSKDYEYGGRKYSYLMQNEDSISLIENDLKKQINTWAEERHIPSFFGGLNANGLRDIPEDKLIKQINNFSKSASSSMPYEEVFGEFEKPFQTRIMNMEALYDALGKKYEGKPNRIDGAALGSNKLFKNGPVQMRSAMGFAKYVMNPVDLDYMFGSIMGTFNPDEVGESANGNWMVSNENGKLMYWAPSATADKQDVLDLMGKGRSLTDDQKRELRRQKFFKANADDIGAILTDSSVKQFEGFKFLDKKSYVGEYGEAGYEQARKEGRVNSSSGIVTLLPEEQGAFHDRATPHWMVMRTAYDLSSDPTIMSQQTAAAIGIDAKTQAKSKEEFARRRFHLQSAEGRIEALRRSPYYSRLLDEDANFAYSKEAESYIQSQIRGLKEKERSGYIALPDEVKAKDLVAAVTPMAWLEPLLEAAGKTVDDLPKELQNIATAELNNTGRIATGGKNLSFNKRAAFNRNPDAPDQRIVAYNMASKALGKFGITQEQLDNAIYLTTQQAYQMNTGDFDGDTIRMYAGLEDASYAHMDYISKKIQEAQAEIEKEESYKGNIEEPKAKTGDVLESRIKALENYQKSTRAMGAASKIIRDAMDLPDSDPQKWKLAYKGMKAYDFASSDMRTKGQELKLDKDTESFLSNGGSYLRFVTKLNELAEEDGRDPYLEKEEEALDQLFKVKFATISGPQGALAVALRAIDYENGSTDFSDFNNNVNRLIERKYGKSASSEAQATRWYAKKFSEMMTGRAMTDEDIVNGYDIAQRWEASLSGRNVSTDEEEYKKYNRFVRRIHELESGEGFTVKNLQTERDRILTEIANGNNVEENRDRFGLIDRLVKHQSKRQSDKAVDSAVRDAIKEQAKITSYDAKAEEEAQKAAEEERLKNGVWDDDHIQMNWTSFKHWMPDKEYRLNTTEFTPSGARNTETTIKSFNNLADQILQAQAELRNQPFENEHTLQGLLMHGAFEQYFKAAADGTLNGRSIDDFYTDAYIGGYNDKLNQYGINISRISKDGEKPLFEVKGDRSNTAVQKLNKILPTKNNPVSSSAKFIKSLNNLGFDTERPVNVEGDFYSYGPNGESLGAIPMQKDFNIQIPIRDKDGQIVGYDTSKRTHAKPDLMLRNKNDGLLYTIDYKSSAEGAAESLIQSIFYNSIMDKYAQEYYENLHSPNPETNATSYKAFAGVGHWDDVAKKYVSDLGGVIGYNPREDAHILARRADNESVFAEVEKDVQYAMEHKMIDAKTLDDEGRAYAAAIARESREKRQAEEYTSRAQENHRDMSQKDREFFLSRYPSDLETMNQIRSSIFREMDLPERKFNRFENYRNKLMEVLPEEVVNAVAYGYDSDSPVREKLTDDIRQKLRLLSQIDKLGSEAAVTDWDKAGEDITNSLNGVQRSNTMKTLSGVTSRLLAAKSSRDFIKKMEVGGESIYRGYITKMGPTGEYKELADAYLSPEEQAELFNVDSDNTKLAEVAREQKKRFLDSIDAEEVAMEEIKPALDRYLKSDKEAQDADWSSLIGEIQDPAEMIEAAFADKRKQIQQKIDNWSNEIKEASEKIVNPDITEDEAEAYAKIIKDRQDRIQQADSFLESDKPEAIVQRDLQQRLGLITQTPEEIVENWRKQRRVAVAGNKLTQEESDAILYEEFQRTGLMPDYTRDASSIMSKEEETKVDKINSQADDMLARLNRQRFDQLAKYQRELTNGNLSSTDRADIKVQQLKDQITAQRDVLGLDDPLRNEYDKILDNKDLWDQYSKRNREDEYFREVMKNAQTRVSKRNLDTLFSGEDFSAKEEFDQMYDQMKLQRDRYKAEHINDPDFDRNAFEQEYSNRRIKARAREQVSFNREQRNLQLDAEGYQLDAQLQGRSMTRDEEIQYRLAQAKASRNARAEKLRRAKRYSEQEALLLANTDPILEQRITEQYDNNQILRQLQRDNALTSSAMQGDIRVHNMQRAFSQANRQQQMRYSRSRIAQALYGVEQRRENAREQVYSIDRQKEDAQRNQDYYTKQLEIAKKSGDQEKINAAQFGYDQATQQLKNLDKASQEAKSQLDQLTSGGQTAQAVFGELGQAIGMVAQRLGRQLFQKALQETKRFVKEFDASMNEIQAITMKSNGEMRDVRTGTINRAIGLRTSVSNVATTEAALYRQGLSDTEVADRTESIIKFATVTKLNVAEATKIITTALQNDLVPSAEAAMDALVALGDSAATTAAEIGKGMQKAAASAKVAGVSYEELTALLTIGTSDTQLSGTQVGTALQTVFSRMRRLSLTGYTADQNGEKTTASDAEAALAAVGVDLWDNKTVGQMRSAYDVMLDLSKVWKNLSDAQKSIVTNAMAGTRQTNIFSTLMEGMSEDNGATLEKYLGLAEGSEGVTQSKYEIAMQSLAASMDTVRSSWDAVVESFVNGGDITNVLDLLSGFLQNIANGSNAAPILGGIAAGIAAIAVALNSVKLGPLAGIATILAALGGFAVASYGTNLLAGLGSTETEREKFEKKNAKALETLGTTKSYNDNDVKTQQDAIDEVKKLGKVYDSLNEKTDAAAKATAGNNLRAALLDLAKVFPNVSDSVQSAIEKLSGWEEAVKSAEDTAQKFKKDADKENVDNANQYVRDYLPENYRTLEGENITESRASEFEIGLKRALSNEQFIRGQGVNFSDDLTKEQAMSINFRDGGWLGLVEGEDENLARKRRANVFKRLWSSDQGKYRNSLKTFLSDSRYEDILQWLDGTQSLDLENEGVLDRISNAYEYVLDQFFSGNFTEARNQEQRKQNIQQVIDDAINSYKTSGTLEQVASLGNTSVEVIESGLRTLLTSQLYDENGNFKREYTRNGQSYSWLNDEGEFNEYALSNWFAQTFDYDNLSNAANEIKSYSETDAPYTIQGVNQTFWNQEDAEKYARDNNIALTKIKNNGTPVYPSTAQKSTQTVTQERQPALAKTEARNRYLNRVLEANTEQSLFDIYDLLAEGAELSNVQRDNPLLYELEQASHRQIRSGVRWSDYQSIAAAMLNGEDTSKAISSLMFNALQGNPNFVEDFTKENGNYSELFKVFQNFFGEQETQRIVEAARNRTLSTDADLQDYVARTLAEKGIKVGTGRTITNKEATDLARNLYGRNFQSLAEAQTVMTEEGWTTDEWSAIQSKYPEIISLLQMKPEQRAEEQEGINLDRNIQIKLNISGISELEEAGKVVQGTTQLLEDLQKNGNVSIKTQLQFGSEMHENQQRALMLENGTYEEQNAAMRAYGISDIEIQKDRAGSLRRAELMAENDREAFAGTLNELARLGQVELAADWAKQNGYEITDALYSYEDAVKFMDRYGFNVLSNGDVVGQSSGKINDKMTQLFWDMTQGKYTYTGKGANIDQVNPFLNAQQHYSQTDIAQAQRRILNGFSRDQFEDKNLYDTAAQSMSTYGTEFRRMVERNREAVSAGGTAVYGSAEMRRAKELADLEASQNEREADRQQLTEQLNMSASRYVRENAQQIVSARDIFTNGSFAEQLGLISGYSDTMRALQQAQYGLEGGNTAENRGYISSLLGLSDEQVDEMLQNGQEGELQTAINDKVKEFYQKLATELLPEELLTSLDFDTMSLDDIISSLDQVPEDLRELIEPFLNAINEAKNGVHSDNTYKSLSDIASSSLESTRKRGAAMSEVYNTLWGEGGEASFSERVSALQQNKNVDWGSIDNGLLYMVNSFGQEGSAITEDMINDAYYNALYGRKASPETQRATMNSLFGGNMSGQNMIDTYRDWMQNQEQYAAEINAFNSLDHSDELANILKSEGVSANTAEKALRKYNEQVNEDKLKDVTQFSKGSANLASALSKIKKGGKDASEGTEMIRKNIEGFQDQMTAISKAQGKSGKQLDTKTLGFIDSLFPEISSDEIKQLSKDRLAELLDGAEDAVNEAATDDFQAIWDSMVDDLSLNYDLSNITVNPDGTLNLDALDDTARAAVEEAIARLEAYAGDLASLTFVQEEGKEKINLKALISKNANGKYHGRGGGGGGGGKSAADKLLEKQKFDVSAIQHDQKMLEIQEKNYDRYNDDAAYRDNVNQQIQVQQRLADQYQKNIQEIENMRRSTKEGSDDWNKLTESLWAAQEAFAGVAEAVDALYAKMDAQQKQLYEYNSTLLQHKQTMSEIDYTFYMNVNDPEAALGEIDKQLTGINDIESEDRRRRAEIVSAMEDEYLRNGESDRYRDLVGERDSLTEKIAKSVNDRITLDATRLDVQRQYQQNEAIPYTHRLNMISSQMERADLNEDTESYNKLFEEQENIYKEIEERNNKHVTQLESLRDYYNSKGQTQNALNTTQEINSLLEQNDNMLTQRDKARKDKLEKEQNDTRESLQRQTMTEEHQNNGYALMANAYKRAGNHGAYRDMMQRQIANWRKMITVQKSLLAIEVQKLKAMVKETEEYYKQLQLVQEIEGKITELEANIANAEMDIMEDRVDEILEGIDRINDLSSHIQKLIKDQGQIYQNQGNWDAYFVMAEKRREELTSSVADMTAQAAQLKAEMGSVPYGSGAWDNLRQKVLSLEESISSARVELENFDRELEGIKVDRLLDEINRHEGNRTHNITLMQYEQTRYQTNGELTNYGIMLQKEIDYRKENTTAMEEELTLLREELENINLSEKDYYRLSDAIKKKEEALLQNNNAIEKNNKLLRQNEQAIRKTRLELEQMVLKVIEDNKKKQRDMLNNTVEMQNIILNVIKRRYQDEWDLEKETLDRKKDALEKEKQLINERLNYRRQMMNAENKYSELNDYQRQLALISADPTRSKESKELTRKIDELRQDIRWDEASQQAEAATERIEDEINAINEYVQIHGENLQEMLLDANNFAAEVKEVLSRSYSDIVLWLQQNDIDYQNSLDERKKQLEEGWKETWMAMKGIVETYWDEINEILSSQDSFMKFMYENSLDYANASVTGQLQLASQWQDGWTNAASAVSVALQAINYTPDIHEDFTPQNSEEAILEALGWDPDFSWYNNGSGYNPSFTSFDDHKNDGKEKGEEEDTKPDDTQPDQPTTEPTPAPTNPSDYAGTGDVVPKSEGPVAPEQPAPSANTGTQQKQQASKSTYDVYDKNGFKTSYSVQASSKTEAQKIVEKEYGSSYSATTHTSTSAGVGGSNVATGVPPLNIDISKPFNDLSNAVGNVLGSFFEGISDLGAKAAEANKQNQEKLLTNKHITGPNAEGGLVDYTGLAWVDGSMSKPEAFLSAYDTANIKALTDALNYVNIEPFRVPNLDKINTSNQTIGDINITINGAEMKDDADFEDVARRVGQEFTKQLRKEGLNLASYTF